VIILIYIDGKYYEKNDAKISVYDHGLLYGDGIFEGIRVYNNKVFRIDEHIKRLFCNAKAIYLDIGVDEEEMKNILLETVEKNNKENAYIRLIITRGDGPLGIDPGQCKKAKIIIIVDEVKLYPEKYYESGISIVTSSYRRIGVESFDVRIKSLNYLNNILAKIEAQRQNCLEAVMLNSNGYVVECTADNIFVVKNNVLKTPPAYNGALEGITRTVVLEIAQELDLQPEEMMMTRYDLYNADEIFLSGTGAEIIPVIGIDGIKIANGKPGILTKKLIKSFKESI